MKAIHKKDDGSVILPSDVNGQKAPRMVTITFAFPFPVFLLLSLCFLFIHCFYIVRIANKELKGKWHRFAALDFFLSYPVWDNQAMYEIPWPTRSRIHFIECPSSPGMLPCSCSAYFLPACLFLISLTSSSFFSVSSSRFFFSS